MSSIFAYFSTMTDEANAINCEARSRQANNLINCTFDNPSAVPLVASFRSLANVDYYSHVNNIYF